ncbi:tRNA (guanosine(37)-N1)-methyltransferase TrmD [Nocardioides coralli]|uniref:tRNA (guanosine(37)-N1)-methyltransferase TrmD n=1 Tax=Nocardioides coralli TaxID=2872154 RepID=UPI001CA44963|nr:tRNA (guanosine(37)-N1)-methyltransferase TrmD [Nocardioides coralli]QZY28127.1 tRNA (guanosine(37)-N1)-methyltransferase TrmD [Nocardioides coralli]
MRIDVVSIFPAYLGPLRLSLPGKAVEAGLLQLAVHDLRDWTHDRHRTVDDTPYGGGAGMVMKPEPWGEALDELLGEGSTLVVPTPSGRPLDQALARELAGRDHLVLACGRYEGIDQRVVDHYAADHDVLEVSIGDYVLNGGEAAALVISEAVVRLLPGFMGNAESLVEESHEAGLLEYPVYTRPARWRDLEVPPVLLGGDHAAIARWRHDQALRRTAQRRPDLAHPARAVDAGQLAGHVSLVTPADVGELTTLQWACFDPDLREEPEALARDLHDGTSFVVRVAGRAIGAVRGVQLDDEWRISLLMVAPDVRGRGVGRFLLGHVEDAAPQSVATYSLLTRGHDARLARFWRKAGYRSGGEESPGVRRMVKAAH